MSVTKRPVLMIAAGEESFAPLAQLFSGRGFDTVTLGAPQDISRHYRREVPAAALVDLDLPDAEPLVQALAPKRPPLVVVAIAPTLPVAGAPSMDGRVDAVFQRPVDAARLFAEVVRLVGGSRTGPRGPRRRNRITGVVAVVDGNELFSLVEQMLRVAVPPLNAAAALEKAIVEMGIHPKTLTRADLASMLASGRLAETLRPFGDLDAIAACLADIRAVLCR